MTDWIKFHAELCEEVKRGLPRATRFIFLEICRKARRRMGEVESVKAPTVEKSIHDLLGGDYGEIRKAIPVLVEHGMIVAVEKPNCWLIQVPSWAKWNSTEKSTDRVQALRAKRRENQAEDLVYFAQRESGGPIKIGHSDNVRDRLTTISLEQKERIRILLLLSGGQPKETELHWQFKSTRLRGEWFAADERLLGFIAENALHDKLPEVFRGVFPEPLLGPFRDSLLGQPRTHARPPAPSPSLSSSISSVISSSLPSQSGTAPAREGNGGELAAAVIALDAGADLYPDCGPTELMDTAKRIVDVVRNDHRARLHGVSADQTIREGVAALRAWVPRFPLSSSAERLGRVERHATDYALRDRDKAGKGATPAPQDSPAERARRAKASAEAKAREEAVAAEKKREAEDFARRRAEGKLPMPTFMTPATPEGGGK